MQTVATLAADLRALGLAQSGVVMVHSSLARLGYVLGGAQTVIHALMRALGPEGTLIMPTFSPEVSDPATWSKARIPKDRLEEARHAAPGFDPQITPTSMGAIPEALRTWPGALRSPHPQVSVTALGRAANVITNEHPLDWAQGPGSPFEKLVTLNAQVLLLGVGFNRATLLHYAEALLPRGRRKTRLVPIDGPAGREWVKAPDSGDDLGVHFPALGAAFVAAGEAQTGQVGEAPSILASAPTLVSFAREYLADALEE